MTAPHATLPGRPHVSGREPFALLGVLLLAFATRPCAAATPEIVSWAGNAPGWNEKLGITMMRQGCDLSPADCLRRLRQAATAQTVSRWALAVKRDAEQWPGDALEYSRRSESEPMLVEVDVDDFLAALKSWHAATLGRANGVLEKVTENLKRHNPRLRFGITLYEDELDSRLIAWIPAETRARIDRVSLYLHYRANANDYARYVADTRRLFPHADIWAGSYAYDRLDYLPCSPADRRLCTADEEARLYRVSLKTQLGLLRGGSITGIEFYPGYFGLEDKWQGWANPRICRPERRAECIENTRRLRAIAVGELAAFRSANASPAAEPR